MWQLIKSYPWTFGIGACILLLAVAGVVVGVVTKGGWKDRGLMVREGRSLRWAHASLPVPVMVQRDLPEPYLEALFAVARFINQRVGLQLLLLPVRIDASVPLNPGTQLPGQCLVSMKLAGISSGTTEHRFDLTTGFITSACVSLPTDLEATPQLLYLVCLHEMLHVLGLEHDDSPTGSVMAPSIRPQSTELKLTDQDAQLLRRTYG